MLRSMTGFGSGQARVADEDVSVEVKSVNHKFCEVKLRLPRELSMLEPLLQKQVKEAVARGALDMVVRRQGATASGAVPVVDEALAREYRRAFLEIAVLFGAPDEPRIEFLAQQPGVLRVEERTVDPDAAQKACVKALQAALGALVTMRTEEGRALEGDLRERLATLRTLHQELRALAPKAVDEYRHRLSERIGELLGGAQLDPARLVQEVALFAERTDVAEELQRLGSHLDQFEALLADPAPSGRRMDFLVQEMHREVNTTGSKSQHAEISTRVVALKAELERIREQVQNVE